MTSIARDYSNQWEIIAHNTPTTMLAHNGQHCKGLQYSIEIIWYTHNTPTTMLAHNDQHCKGLQYSKENNSIENAGRVVSITI